MTEPFDVATGQWWKFDRYELRDGCICPTEGAIREQYDPWVSYRRSFEKDRVEKPPYQSLLELLEDFIDEEDPEANSVRFSPESEARLCQWCSEHGLLGVLLQRVLSVAFPPRWLSASDDPDDVVSIEQRIIARGAGGWSDGNTYLNVEKPTNIQFKEGDIAPREFWPSGIAPASVLIEPFVSRVFGSRTLEPLGQTWSRFFPVVPDSEAETYPYPYPSSPDFWRLYAEPLEDFLSEAVAFQQAVLQLNAWKEAPVPLDAYNELDSSLKDYPGEARFTLQDLVQGISPTINHNADGSLRQDWTAPSLIASFAMMALQDLTGRRRLLRCETCHNLFITEAYQAHYCSETCRHTAQKRRHRAKLRAKQQKQQSAFRRNRR